jgi:glycosyltransferase involved in cell wall biosynthesis
MKIGVFYPEHLPFSARNYIENVTHELERFGIKIIFFTKHNPLPRDVDLFWDPRSMGGAPPYQKLLTSEKPLVVTVHGSAPFVLPAREFFSNLKEALIGKLFNFKKLIKWRKFSNRYNAIITVSLYAKKEIQRYLRLEENKIFHIYHGVDLRIFTLGDGLISNEPFFLHVSQYQPKKNINRILEAFRMLPNNKPELIMIVPGYNGATNIKKVRFILDRQSPQNLASWYKGALAFVFPSLHETFGMPILEAMACGCPVITSNVTACPEIAGDAALLVNPRSVNEIASAMKRLITNRELRETLKLKGLRWASMFTWEKSAEEHLRVFEKVLKGE